MVQIGVGHLLAVKMRYTRKINQVHFIFGCDSQCVRVPGMPFHGMEYIMIRCRGYTQEKCATEDIRSIGGNRDERLILRNVISDQFRQFPNDKASIRCHPSQPISINCHICDAGSIGKHVWELEESTISTGSRNYADPS